MPAYCEDDGSDAQGASCKLQIRDLVTANIVSAFAFLAALALREFIDELIEFWLPVEHRHRYRLMYMLIYTIITFALLVIVTLFLFVNFSAVRDTQRRGRSKCGSRACRGCRGCGKRRPPLPSSRQARRPSSARRTQSTATSVRCSDSLPVV